MSRAGARQAEDMMVQGREQHHTSSALRSELSSTARRAITAGARALLHRFFSSQGQLLQVPAGGAKLSKTARLELGTLPTVHIRPEIRFWHDYTCNRICSIVVTLVRFFQN